MRTALLVTVFAAGSLAGGGGEASERWTRFVSAAGFSVDRPANWEVVATSPGRLDIVNLRCPSQGAAICDGQAEITVTSEPATGKATHSRACWNLSEAVSERDEGPGRRAQNRVLSCTIGARRFQITERHWKGDKHAANYGRIVMRMAKSLRYPD